MSKLIYIASPYSHKDPEEIDRNFERVSKYTAQCTSLGEVVLSPITHGHTLSQFVKMPQNWEFWQNICETMLINCDSLRVLKMNGWETSEGVTAEIEFAKAHGIPIEYVEFNID
jgi:hypothetical protein